jgi:hypothetical protein
MDCDDAEEPGVPIPDRSAQVWFDRNTKKQIVIPETTMTKSNKSKASKSTRKAPGRKSSRGSVLQASKKGSNMNLTADTPNITSGGLRGRLGIPIDPLNTNLGRPGTTSNVQSAYRGAVI